MNCPNCGTPATQGAQRCGVCGYEFRVWNGTQGVQPVPSEQVPPQYSGVMRKPSPVTPAVAKTVLISLGIGLASAVVLAVISSVISGVTSMLSALSSSASPLSGLSDLSALNPKMNFFQLFIAVLMIGVSGSLSYALSANAGSLAGMNIAVNLWMPLGLSGAALFIGAAFGAFMFAKKYGIHIKWIGVASAAVVGAASGVIYLILAFIGTSETNTSYMGAAVHITVSSASVRTFFMAFLVAGVGSLSGYFLAQYAPDSGNIFTAAWRWMHRTRGFVRTVVEGVAIYSAVFTVLGVVLIVIVASAQRNLSLLGLLVFIFPFVPIMLGTVGSFGVISSSSNSPGAALLSNTSVFSHGSFPLWALWVCIIVFLITTAYYALRISARNMYDPYYAGWHHLWKAPVTSAGLWLVATFLIAFLNLNANMNITSSVTSGSSEKVAATLSPAFWFFLLAAVWQCIADIIALTCGPRLVQSLHGLWRVLVGGTVKQTPPEVTQYVLASGVFSIPLFTAKLSVNATAVPQAHVSQMPEQSGAAGLAVPTQVSSQTQYGVPMTDPNNTQPAPEQGVPPVAPVNPVPPQAVPQNAPQMVPQNAQPGQPVQPVQPTAPIQPPTQQGPSTPANQPNQQPAPSAYGMPVNPQTTSAPGYGPHQGSTAGPAMPYGQAQVPPTGQPGVPPVGQVPTSPAGQPGIPPTQTPPQGYAQMQAAPGPYGAPVAAVKTPMSPKTKLTIIIVSIVAGVCILLGIAYGVLSSTVFNAEKVVNSYLSAIASGNLDEANKIANPQVSADQGALLTNNALKTNDTRIANVSIVGTTKNADGSERVNITYTVGGKQVTDYLNISNQGSKYLIFKNWVITSPLIKEIGVSSSDYVKAVQVNGIDLSEKNSSDSSGAGAYYTFKVYPGVYSVSTVKSKYITSNTVKLTVGGTLSTGYASLNTSATSQLKTDIEAEMKKTVDECAKSTDAKPAGCPFSMYTFSSSQYQGIKWSITQYPTAGTVSLYSNSFYSSGGKATASYQENFFNTGWDSETYTDYFYMEGSFTIDGDNLTVTFDTSNY